RGDVPMTDLRELYQEVILDHGRRPRNFGELPEANRHAEGYNPLCGDTARVFLNLDGGVVKDTRFHGLVTGTAQGVPELGKLTVFAGVSEFPVRVKCASLPWHTLKAALDGS